MQACHRIARVFQGAGLAQQHGGGVPVLLPQLGITLHQEAHGLGGLLGLHRTRHGHGLGRFVLHQRQAELGLLHQQILGRNLGGAPHSRSHGGFVLGQGLGVCQAQLRQG